MCLSHICFPLLASTTVSLYIRFAYAKEVKWKIKHGDDKREWTKEKKIIAREQRFGSVGYIQETYFVHNTSRLLCESLQTCLLLTSIHFFFTYR